MADDLIRGVVWMCIWAIGAVVGQYIFPVKEFFFIMIYTNLVGLFAASIITVKI